MVIDCGPDFRQQMLVNNLKKLNVLFFTHEHADHTAGLDDIRPFYFRQGDIPIYGTKRVIKNLSKRFSYIFSNKDKYPSRRRLPTLLSSFHIQDLKLILCLRKYN